MNKILLLINGILAVAVIVLFYIVLSDRGVESREIDSNLVDDLGQEQIVFINTDSLIIKYDFARQLSEDLIKKEESARADFNQRARVFQQEMMEFQRKIQNNAFLSLERAQSEEQRLRQKEMELQELNTRLSNEIMMHHERMNTQLRDTLLIFLEGYTRNKPYKLVLSNTMGDNILYARPGLDITNDVVGILNDRFSAALAGQ